MPEITHAYVNPVADTSTPPNATRPSHWNEPHVMVEVPFDHNDLGSAETIDVTTDTWHRGNLNVACAIAVSGFVTDEAKSVTVELTGTGAITWGANVDFGGADDQPNASGYTVFVLHSSTGDGTVHGVKVGGEISGSLTVPFLDLGLSGTAFTVDWSDAPSQYVTLNNNTDATLTGVPAMVGGETVEGRGRLWIETDGTDVITWPVTVVWQDAAPDLTAAGLYFVDFITFDGGTTFYGVFGGGSSMPDGTDPGDLLVWDGAAWAVLPVGADDEVLTADSGEALGVKWAAGDPASDTAVWMPLTTVDGGEPVIVWDGDDNLIPTLVPV